MRKATTLLLALGLVCAAQAPKAAEAAAPAKRVLFIGNSYTYYWNLPKQVMAMAESQDAPLEIRQSTYPGANLGQHWNGGQGLLSRRRVRTGGFDAVILQDHSLSSIETPESLRRYARRFHEVIAESGARTYLYVTWARANDPGMQATITPAFEKLAAELGATLVPVGPAWARARLLRPRLDLHTKDHSHPSPAGAYLTACVFYGVLTGKSPLGLPRVLTTRDEDGAKVFLNVVSPGDAQFLQKVAAETLGPRAR